MGRPTRSSVIVVTYNHRWHIEQCLRALLPTLGPEDQVTVVDNASSDGTAAYVARTFPTVELVANTDNRGFGAACNQAAQRAEGEYLAFLNPDAEPLAGWLDTLLGALESAPGAGLATPKLLLRRRPGVIDTFGHDVHISGIATCRGWGEPAAAHPSVEQVAAVSGACFVIRRDLFAQLGGFDERLFLYYEDDDLSLRARFAGYTCVAVPTAHVLHDHRPGFAPEKLRYLERNRLWTTLRLYRWPTLLGLVPVLLLAEMLGWGMAVVSGPRHIIAKLQACWDLARWLPCLPLARRQVQRVVSDRVVLQAHRPHLAFAQVASGPMAHRAERVTAAAFQLLAPR
jgi:GT2 family glycosyltransferase